MYQLSSKAQFISLKSRNLILECNLKCSLLGYCHYRPNQLFKHTSLLTLAGERISKSNTALPLHPRLKKNNRD